MSDSKEILIQDLRKKEEIERYLTYHVYRRGEIHGNALYFAPYFTRGSGQVEGIKYISRILGILTMSPNDIGLYKEDLRRFTDDKKLIDRWQEGVNIRSDNEKYTFYFLATSFEFKKPLRKDPGNKAGRGKNWIAAMIPKNRRVGFIELLEHIPELKRK